MTLNKFTQKLVCLILSVAFAQFAEAKKLNFAANSGVKISAAQTTNDSEKTAVAEVEKITAEIVKDSYPELQNAKIVVKPFESRGDYFRSRFSVSRFLTLRRLHYLIFVNPQVFERNAPPAAIRAIIAHELAHADYYRRHNRFELLGLVSLQSKSFTLRFERGADLQAIKRGYGEGLISYREWLYKNIPADKLAAKKRDYFSPEEIDLILQAIKEKPALIDFWIKNVPRNLKEIQSVFEEV